MLHELANRAGHTALLIGGSSINTEMLARVDTIIRRQISRPLSLKTPSLLGPRLTIKDRTRRSRRQQPHNWGLARSPFLSSGPTDTSASDPTSIMPRK